MNAEKLRPYIRRFILIALASFVIVFAGSELAFRYLLSAGDTDRGPQTIVLTIPEGTAESIENGAGAPVEIPEEMTFVLGDTLVVHNRDSVVHELGPLLIPPNTSASMPMDQADNVALSCSFQTTRYLGLEVREPTTLGTRLYGVAFAAPATTMIVFLYSLAYKPIKDPTEEIEEV